MLFRMSKKTNIAGHAGDLSDDNGGDNDDDDDWQESGRNRAY